MATTTKTAAKLDLSILSSSSEDETIVAATSRSGIERRTRHKRNTSSISLKDIQESGSLPSSRRRISPSLASASASQPTSASSRKSSGDNTVDLSNSRPNSTSTGPTRTSLELSPQKITRLRQDENRRRSSYGELSGANSSKPSISILTDSLSKTPKSPILLGSNIAPHSPSKFTSRSYGTNRGFESRRIRRNSRPSDIKPQGPASLKSQHRRSDTDHSPGFLSSGRYRRDASAAYSDYSNGEDELTPRPRKFNSHGKGILSASPDQLFPTFAPFHNYPTPSASSDEGSSYISPKNHSTNTPPPITHQPATPPPEASLRKQSVPSNIDVFAFMEVQSPMPVPTPLSAPMTEKPVLKKLDLVDVDLGFKEAPKDTKPESGSMSPVGSEGTLVDSPGRELPGKELPTRGLRGKDLSMKFVQSFPGGFPGLPAVETPRMPTFEPLSTAPPAPAPAPVKPSKKKVPKREVPTFKKFTDLTTLHLRQLETEIQKLNEQIESLNGEEGVLLAKKWGGGEAGDEAVQNKKAELVAWVGTRLQVYHSSLAAYKALPSHESKAEADLVAMAPPSKWTSTVAALKPDWSDVFDTDDNGELTDTAKFYIAGFSMLLIFMYLGCSKLAAINIALLLAYWGTDGAIWGHSKSMGKDLKKFGTEGINRLEKQARHSRRSSKDVREEMLDEEEDDNVFKLDKAMEKALRRKLKKRHSA